MTSSWSNNNQTVTFSFRPGAQLPTDKDSSKLAQYALSFKEGSIRDANGTGRNNYWFRTSPAQINKVGYKFTVAADTTNPKMSAITPVNKDELTTSTADRIRAQFSETMALYPNNMAGKPIPDTTNTGYAATAENFRFFVSPVGTTTMPDSTTTLPGGFDLNTVGSDVLNTGFLPTGAKYYDGDATRSTVELTPGTSGSNALFASTTINGANHNTATSDPDVRHQPGGW